MSTRSRRNELWSLLTDPFQHFKALTGKRKNEEPPAEELFFPSNLSAVVPSLGRDQSASESSPLSRVPSLGSESTSSSRERRANRRSSLSQAAREASADEARTRKARSASRDAEEEEMSAKKKKMKSSSSPLPCGPQIPCKDEHVPDVALRAVCSDDMQVPDVCASCSRVSGSSNDFFHDPSPIEVKPMHFSSCTLRETYIPMLFLPFA